MQKEQREHILAGNQIERGEGDRQTHKHTQRINRKILGLTNRQTETQNIQTNSENRQTSGQK